MQIFIGCIDGKTYAGDWVSDEVIQEHLDSVDGRIGTGAWSDEIVATVDDFVEFMNDMLSGSRNGYDTTALDLVIDGKARTFKPDHIVWHRIERDGDAG